MIKIFDTVLLKPGPFFLLWVWITGGLSVVFVPLLKVHPVLMVIGLVLLNGEGKYPLCALLALVLCVCRYVGVR
jgi:pheromone shutdown protein TraB